MTKGKGFCRFIVYVVPAEDEKLSYLELARKALADYQRRQGEAACLATEEPTTPADDPILTVDQWYPEFRNLHRATIAECGDFDYDEAKKNQPKLYTDIKNIENRIDAIDEVRLSVVVSLMREWRHLLQDAVTEQRRATTKTT